MAKTEKKVINLEDFFTTENEKAGVWVEPKIDGNGCGFELLVCGSGTDEAMADDEHYESLYAKAESIKDPIERKAEQMRVDAERCARLVKGIRAVKGYDLNFGGEGAEYSVPLIEKIFLCSPLIKKYVVNFATKTSNFIKRESNA